VVPLPHSSATAVLKYQEALRKYAPSEKPDFVSLEGYLAGTLLVEASSGRRRWRPRRSSTRWRASAPRPGHRRSLSFGMSEHQASHKVWGTMLDEKGVFQTFQLD